MVLSETVIHLLEPAKEIAKLSNYRNITCTCQKAPSDQFTTQQIMPGGECKVERQVGTYSFAIWKATYITPIPHF